MKGSNRPPRRIAPRSRRTTTRSPDTSARRADGPRPYALPGGAVRQTFALIGRGIADSRRTSTIAILASALYGVGTVASGWVLGRLTDTVVAPALTAGRVEPAEAWGAGGLLLLVGLVTATAVALRRTFAGWAAYEIQAAHRLRVTRQYLRLPVSWHRRHPTGRLLSNAGSDAEAAAGVFHALPMSLGVLVMLVVASVAMIVADPVLGAVGATVLPLVVAANGIYRKHMTPAATLSQRLRASVADVAHESFEASLLVTTLSTQDAEERRFSKVTDELRDANVTMGRIRAVFEPVIDLLAPAATLAVIALGAWRVRNGDTATGDVVTISYLLTVIAMPVRAIGWALGEVPRSLVGYGRIARVVDAGGALSEGATTLPGSGGLDVRLDHVTLTVPARMGAERHDDGTVDLLDDVSFQVPAGRTVALVGPTGAGKSTVISLVARLSDPTSGRVLLDGVDARDVAPADLTSAVALVGQSAFVFHDTVRANVTLDDGDRFTDDDVWAALRAARADGFVRALPEGLDTVVGERGASLSGGQRQRLALARALVRRPRLLVLDDATSAVDPLVEREILSGLGRNDGEPDSHPDGQQRAVTLLVVAYRTATIALADHVVHLDGGRVADVGTHEELLERDAGYRELVTAYATRSAERERVR